MRRVLMFESNELNNDRVEKALGLFRQYGRGEVVPHGEMAAAIGVDEGQTAYYQVVKRARARLLDEDGVCVTPEHSVGWRLLTEQQTIVDEPIRRSKRARRQIGHALRAAISLPTDSLTPLQVRLRDAQIGHSEELRRQLSTRQAMAKKSMEVHRGLPLRTVCD
jgi:hypothetical protein